MKLVLSVKMTENKMFPLSFSKLTINVFSASSDDSVLWHRQYGHLNFGGLHLLHELNMVTGFPNVGEERKTCEACVYGEQHREQFPVGKSWRAHKPLMLVHADICGAVQTLSLNGRKKIFYFCGLFYKNDVGIFFKGKI